MKKEFEKWWVASGNKDLCRDNKMIKDVMRDIYLAGAAAQLKKTEVWVQRKNGLCQNWCNVDCPHGGGR